MSEDEHSIFSYDGVEDVFPHPFSLTALASIVNAHFQTTCRLEKLAEGAYHKVYDIVNGAGTSLAVARVAAPDFPKDKVATIKHIALNTKLPVPQIFAWDSDASNPVGAEYMIMQKLPGTPAHKDWDILAPRIKERVVCQLADHLSALFALRFDRLGSLYLSPKHPSDEIVVGPLISEPFYSSPRVPPNAEDAQGNTWLTSLNSFRGPYSTTTAYLQSYIIPELHFATCYPSLAQAQLDKKNTEAGRICYGPLELAERTLRKLVDLCSLYPGDGKLDGPLSPYNNAYSLALADVQLSNILIDTLTGDVTGLIDLEGTRIAPLWECALVPPWLQPRSDHEGAYEGGTKKTRRILRELFLSHMPEHWLDAYRLGRPFRLFRDQISLPFVCWAMEEDELYVDEIRSWVKEHPGIGFPEAHAKALWERNNPGLTLPSSSSESDSASES